jgi:hypothetical protein
MAGSTPLYACLTALTWIVQTRTAWYDSPVRQDDELPSVHQLAGGNQTGQGRVRKQDAIASTISTKFS